MWTDGVKALIEQHVADPRGSPSWERAMAAMQRWPVPAFTPDLYACAVSVGGVLRSSGHARLFRSEVGDESDTVAYWRVSIGAAYDAKCHCEITRACRGQFHIPILLLHGVDDTVVPIGQSEGMARALDRLHKENLLVKLPGEDHWLSRSATRAAS